VPTGGSGLQLPGKRTEPLLLFSAGTLLACRINEKYYRGKHWVMCSAYFSRQSVPPLGAVVMPPSSTPHDICQTLRDDIANGDTHSAKIQKARVGILTGAQNKLRARVITQQQFAEIEVIVQQAPLGEFSPVVYLIPFAGVRNIAQPVPVPQRAHPFSPEFLIPELDRSLFEVVQWW
jgi:hypothetical protein